MIPDFRPKTNVKLDSLHSCKIYAKNTGQVSVIDLDINLIRILNWD